MDICYIYIYMEPCGTFEPDLWVGVLGSECQDFGGRKYGSRRSGPFKAQAMEQRSNKHGIYLYQAQGDHDEWVFNRCLTETPWFRATESMAVGVAVMSPD